MIDVALHVVDRHAGVLGDLPPAERRDKRIKQLEGRFESVYGRLEEPQRAVLRQQLDAWPFDPAKVLAERQRRQADTMQMLRQLQSGPLGPAEARRVVQAWLARAQASPDAAFRQQQEQGMRQACQLVAAVHAAATPAQREAAVERPAHSRRAAIISPQTASGPGIASSQARATSGSPASCVSA